MKNGNGQNGNKLDLTKLTTVDPVSKKELSEIKRYIELMYTDGKIPPVPGGSPVQEVWFDDYGGILEVQCEDGSQYCTLGADGVTEEWMESYEEGPRSRGEYPKTTNGVPVQTWSKVPS